MLIALGIPFRSIRFLPADASELPASASAYQVDHGLRTEFPPGRTSPLEVVVGAPAGSPELRALADRISALPDVSAVAPAAARRAHALAARRRSRRRRHTARPPNSSSTDVRALPTPFYLGVAGDTAGYVDLEHSLGTHLPSCSGWSSPRR